MSGYTPEQMAEREAEIRASHEQVSRMLEGQEPNPLVEDVGALLEMLDTERAVKTGLLEALQSLVDSIDALGKQGGPKMDCARAAIAKATGEGT